MEESKEKINTYCSLNRIEDAVAADDNDNGDHEVLVVR